MIKEESGHIVVEVPICQCQIAGEKIEFCQLHHAAGNLYRSCCESMYLFEKVIVFWIYGRTEEISLPTRSLAQETLHRLLQSIRSADNGQSKTHQQGEGTGGNTSRIHRRKRRKGQHKRVLAPDRNRVRQSRWNHEDQIRGPSCERRSRPEKSTRGATGVRRVRIRSSPGSRPAGGCLAPL